MTAQEYIASKLRKLAEPIPHVEVDKTQLEEAILDKVLSKKFRKVRADQPAVDAVKKAIRTSVESGSPIRLTLFFGGNKLWRLDEAPHIEWGELFSLIYYVNWAKSIASVYKPGVLLEYFSMDVCVGHMNNVPHEQTDKYSEDFQNLLVWAKPYVPDGVTIRYTRYGDFYKDRAEFYEELDEAKRVWLKDNGGKLPELDDAHKAAVELNVKLKPGQDQDPLWREKVEHEHQSIFGTKSYRAFRSDPMLIPHCPTWYSGFIATGSTKRSLAKFWVGTGALEPAGDSYNDIILTPKQLQTVQFDWETVRIDGLEGENFSRVRVLRDRL